MLRAVIQLPSDHNDEDGFEKVSTIVMLCLYLADKVSALRISPKVRADLDKTRKKLIAEQKAKVAEANQDVVNDKRRKEREAEEAKLAKMTPEQQRKYTEKQEKRDKDRKRKSMVKMAKI